MNLHKEKNNRLKNKSINKDTFINTLIKISLIILSILLIVATYKSILYEGDFNFLDTVEDNIILIYVIGVIFLFLLILTIFKIIDKFKLENKKIVPIIGFGIIIILQLVFACNLRTLPVNDPGIIHDEAMTIIEDNNISNKIHWNYFTRCTNNIPFTIFLGIIYKGINFIGISDFILARCILCMLFIDISILLAYLLIKNIKNKNIALKFLVICMLNPLLYMEVTYLYTNTISLAFIMAIIFVFYKLIKAKKTISRVLLTILLGIVSISGGLVRATNYIVLIALIIYLIFKLIKNKKLIKNMLIYGIIFILACAPTMLLYKKIESKFIKFDYEDTATPWSHYVMMGLGENGRYSTKDVNFTKSFDTKEEKIEANLEEAWTRIKEHNLSGLLDLASSKIQTVWSEGTSKYMTTSAESENYNKLYKYTIGSKRDGFVLYTQMYRITILLFTLISTLLYLKNPKLEFNYIIYLTLLGAMVFYVIWEANKTYAICFMPLLMCLATYGINSYAKKKESCIKKNYNKVFIGILGLTTILLISNYNHFTKTNGYIDKEISINQSMCTVNYITRVYGDTEVIQVFKTNKAFNTIEIELKNPRKATGINYHIDLLNKDGNIIYQTIIPSEQIINGTTTIINCGEVKPQGTEEYTLKIYGDGKGSHDNSIDIGAYISEEYDKVKDAEAYRNGEKINGDLQFSVYNSQNKPFFSKQAYIILSIVIIFMEVIIYLIFNALQKSNKDELKMLDKTNKVSDKEEV